MQINRRGFFGAAAVAAGAGSALRGEPQATTSAKGDFHLGSVTYNLLKDYDVRRSSRPWRRWGLRRWNCGPNTSMASNPPSAQGTGPASGTASKAAECGCCPTAQ